MLVPYDTPPKKGNNMSKKIDDLFQTVSAEINFAELIAWDGCHKIYLAMDNTQAEWFATNYDNVMRGDSTTLYETVRTWWDNSCGLRFISAVYTNEDDPNAGYVSLISQFEDNEDEDDDD